MDLHRTSRSRASSGTEAAPSVTSSLEMSIQTRIFKIIVIGDSNVGKTCLTFRFTGGSFPDKTEATIGVDFREKAVELEGETIKVRRGCLLLLLLISRVQRRTHGLLPFIFPPRLTLHPVAYTEYVLTW